MREKTRAHGCDHVLFPFPHPQDRPGVPHVAAAAGQIPQSWPAPSANFGSAHSSNVIPQTSMTVVSRLSAARSAGLACTGSGGRSRGRDRGRPRLPRPLDHLTEPRAPLSYTPWDTLTGLCIWCFPLRDDRFLRVRRRAGLPHPAHLQERKLSTSKPRYKGGEKVHHCGGGIVYHPHDEKGLNWEPGGVRPGAGVRRSGLSQESSGSSETW